MFWLGLMSIVQVAFLPGYLALRMARLAVRPVSRTLVLSFALSLVINHFLVVGLVLAGWYRPGVIYAVFAVEAALGLWAARTWSARSVGETATRLAIWARRTARAVRREPLGRRLAFGTAALLIAGFAAHALAHAGDIFQQWDAVISWNRWAMDWAANGLPHRTAEYPQLLPTNLSLTYVFIQDSLIWFFAKGLMSLFCLFLLLAMLDLGRATGRTGYFWGVPIAYGLLVAVLRFRFLSSGYGDVPVAFMAFAGVYALLLAQSAGEPALRTKYVLLGAVLCAAPL